MAYVKNIWVDQDVERPKTYEVTNNQDGSITLTDSFGLVTELGTPVNEVNMNHIEDGIDGCAIRKHNLTETFNLGEWVLGGTGDDEGIYKSLIANNVGNAISDNTKWEKVEMGEGHLHALKSYLDEGELLTDAEGLADVKSYAHSTFDASKFTIVGSPTISADGILNATTNNYPKSPTINFSTASSWKIKTKFKTPTTAIDQSLYSGLTNPIITVVYGITKKFRFAVGNGSSWFLSNIETTHTFSLDTEHEVSLEFNGTNYTLYVDGAQEATGASSSKIADTPLSFGVDRTGASVNSPNGTIDLKIVDVVLDGVPVFSGNKTGTDTYTIGGSTVTIPYTLSKTGSKIVDSAYRTQVTSVYNTFGYAPYYTLSDTNFTLPQGEIYGMMLKQDVPHIVETYVSGQSWYLVYSNGWCRQGGFVDMSSSSATVVLLKGYKDTNYSVSLTIKYDTYNAYAPAVNTLSTNQFTAYTNNANCDLYWVTEGYIA